MSKKESAMTGIQEAIHDTEEEDMDQDTAESDLSDDESESSSGSDEEDESEIDEGVCEKRKDECLNDMSDLHQQFLQLREYLYKERQKQVEEKLEEVRAGKAPEYLQPLAVLQEDMRIATQVAGILRELKLRNVRHQYEAEEQAARQNYESDKALLYDQVKEDLEDKIRRLEEDRNNIDISSDLWNETQEKRKRKKTRVKDVFGTPERRRKPVTVSGPYVVYMLKDVDIIDDWTAIKKALKQAEKQDTKKRKDVVPKLERFPYESRYEDGKLFYENEWYSKGHHIIIDNREDSPVHATVTSISSNEVCVKRADGNKAKLFINQLQKGKYTIRHVPY